HRSRQKRKLALAFRREGALRFEATLEILQLRSELAHVVELDLVGDKAHGAVLRPVIDPATEDENLAILRQCPKEPCVVRVDERVDEALAVADDKAVVSLGALLHAADLAFEQQRGQRAELTPDLVGELSDGIRTLSFLGPNHGD